MIIWWKILRVKSDELDSTGKPKTKTIPILKHYHVWSLDQCTGIEAPEAPEEPVSQFTPIERAQIVIDKMPDRPRTIHGGEAAQYQPSLDLVKLPHREQFNTPEDYYSTAYHEYAHSTGHQKRLGRKTDWTAFGDDPYAQEELVAEFCAAMLCGTVGINVTYEQSASYIQHWRERFKDDPRLLISAAGLAQKAADFISGKSFETEAETEAEKVAEEELSHA
jgi:antirestriction protein ArdC